MFCLLTAKIVSWFGFWWTDDKITRSWRNIFYSVRLYRWILKFQSLPVSNITGNNCGGVPTVTSAMLTKISYLYLMHSHSFGQNLWYFQRTLYTFVVTDSEKSIVERNEVRLCYWTEGTKKSGKKSNSIF